MKRDWRDFKSLHSNIEGARSEFERACETLYRKIFSRDHVQQVEVSVGDGGIDIFIGEIGVAPITVIQCKFFLEEFGEAQQAQIRSSFKKAKESTEFELKEWILCIPIVLDLTQNKWWTAWKKKQEATYGLAGNFIQLRNGNALIDLFKEQDLYPTVFQINEAVQLAHITEKVGQLCGALLPSADGVAPTGEPGMILFNHYTKDAEPYYLSRKVDAVIIEKLKHGNVWVHGISGAGKTALILRAVLSGEADYLYCDYSPVDITNAGDILDELKYGLIEKYGLTETTGNNNKIKEVCGLLNQRNSPQEMVIVLDELSFPSKEIEIDFAKTLIQLAAFYYKQEAAKSLRFVISTIPEPLSIIKNRGKASEHFSYVSVDNWDGPLEELLTLLLTALDISLTGESRQLILEKSNGSPRLLKNILRKLISDKESLTDSQVADYAQEAQSEYF